MRNRITSVQNDRIKKVVRLRNHKDRLKLGLTIVEGRREVQQALDAKCDFKEFYICKDFLVDADHKIIDAISKLKIDCFEVTDDVFNKISYGDRKEGIVAICVPKVADIKSIAFKKDAFVLVVESVEKPGNLGAILRSCDGAGVDLIIISDEKTDIFNPNVIRSSLGTVFTQKVIASSNEDTYEYLKSNKIKIAAATPHSKSSYTKADLNGSLAIVVGSEQDGLSDFWIKKSDMKLKIPMKGCADSLNVSTSTAILLYEALRQRHE
ncbi:MAG: RNA methyltransferase [Candidatus Zapsychrus exili]|nr:RNA methyltransferase [Candidatus Zapsychrus exili]